MTQAELYKQIGGDHEDVKKRLRYEPLIDNLLKMFLEDQNFPRLTEALRDKDWQEVFAAAHALKGTCATLGFTRLEERAAWFADASRGGKRINGYILQQKKMNDEYNIHVRAVSRYLREKEKASG